MNFCMNFFVFFYTRLAAHKRAVQREKKICEAHLREIFFKGNTYIQIYGNIHFLTFILMCGGKRAWNTPKKKGDRKRRVRSRGGKGISTLHKVSCVSQKKDLAKVLCQIERQARKARLDFNAKKQLKLATLARTHTLLRPRTHTHTHSHTHFA